jgi:hypothetical protein
MRNAAGVGVTADESDQPVHGGRVEGRLCLHLGVRHRLAVTACWPTMANSAAGSAPQRYEFGSS